MRPEVVDGVGCSFGLRCKPGKVRVPIEAGRAPGVIGCVTAERKGDSRLARGRDDDGDPAARFSQGPTDSPVEFARFEFDRLHVRQMCLTSAERSMFGFHHAHRFRR